MKRFLLWALIFSMLLGLWGCGPVQAGNPSEAETSPAEAPTGTPTETPTEAPAAASTEVLPEGNLYLTVSSITFSLVGESEDIYMGLVPRELVTWESDDPSVVSVDNGVLTATGTGTTTVRAICADREVSCTAGCLARTREELESLGEEVLTRPKRMVPQTDLESPCTFYDNSALVGDSIALMMIQNENPGDYLGNLLVLARNGTSLLGYVRYVKDLFYQGKEMHLEDAIAKSGVDCMYILIGSNDLADSGNRGSYMSNWELLLEHLHEKAPDVEVVVLSNLPRCRTDRKSKAIPVEMYNGLVAEYNPRLEQFCRDHGCTYLNIARYIEDHRGSMALEYNHDGHHMNEAGYLQWIKFMRYYAQYKLEGGTL